MTCAIETWWGGSRKWVRCKLKASDGRYCIGHAWANTFRPFWDPGSRLDGSLIHRSAQAPGKEGDR